MIDDSVLFKGRMNALVGTFSEYFNFHSEHRQTLHTCLLLLPRHSHLSRLSISRDVFIARSRGDEATISPCFRGIMPSCKQNTAAQGDKTVCSTHRGADKLAGKIFGGQAKIFESKVNMHSSRADRRDRLQRIDRQITKLQAASRLVTEQNHSAVIVRKPCYM